MASSAGAPWPNVDPTPQALEDTLYSTESNSRLLASTNVSPQTISALISRIRALVQRLIPVEVEEESITGREGIIDGNVESAFDLAGGDFAEAVPYALLEARKTFLEDADNNPSEYVLHSLRATASEVLARRVVARSERNFKEGKSATGASGPYHAERSHLSLTKKFRQVDEDGDVTLPTSALEAAIDQHCIYFLSSTEAQRCVSALWSGHLVQSYGPDGEMYFQPYHEAEDGSFLSHLDPARLAVPKYQYHISVITWIFFIVLYSISTRTFKGLDVWEVLFWVMAASYLVEDIARWFKLGGLDSIQFWTIVDVATDSLFAIAFVLRVMSFSRRGDWETYQLRSFQFLSCLAPLLWIQLLKLFDGFAYFGVLQVIVLRMLKESAVFFTLLVLVAIGFAQALWALDAADGKRVPDAAQKVIDALVQAIFGGADFDLAAADFGYPFGHILYYCYTFLTAIILVNILIAFFGTAYAQVEDKAIDVYKGFYSAKVVSLVRAPDQFVYLPPFNLIEAFIIAPFEYFLPRNVYARINKVVQSTLFCIPLLIIAIYESRVDARQVREIRRAALEGVPADRTAARDGRGPETVEDPDVHEEGENEGMILSRVKFADLVKKLPNLEKSEPEEKGQVKSEEPDSGSLALILEELRSLRQEIAQIKREGATPSADVKAEADGQ